MTKIEEKAKAYTRNHKQLYGPLPIPCVVVRSLEENAYRVGYKQALEDVRKEVDSLRGSHVMVDVVRIFDFIDKQSEQ